LFSLTENGKLEMQKNLKRIYFCRSLLYNPLQRYTRSLDIKGRNPETLGQTQRVGNRTQGCKEALYIIVLLKVRAVPDLLLGNPAGA